MRKTEVRNLLLQPVATLTTLYFKVALNRHMLPTCTLAMNLARELLLGWSTAQWDTTRGRRNQSSSWHQQGALDVEVDLNAQESAEADDGGADVKLALVTNPFGRGPGFACVGLYLARLRGTVLLLCLLAGSCTDFR